MKTQLTQMLQNFHGQGRHRQAEAQLRKLQTQNLQLDRALKEKEREIDALKHQIANYEARIKEMRGTDELTGLPNRLVFKDHLTHSLKRAVRLGYSLSLMLVDVNHLREINLRYGHEVGDQVIIEIAKILRSSVREIDMPARWGGEELVAVLHETDAEGASVVADRVRRRVAALEVKNPKDGSRIKVTASVAIASCPKHGNEPQSLLESVCDALVEAKSADQAARGKA